MPMFIRRTLIVTFCLSLGSAAFVTLGSDTTSKLKWAFGASFLPAAILVPWLWEKQSPNELRDDDEG